MMKLSDFTILNLFSVINKTCIHEKIETKIVISRRNPPGWTLAEHIKSLRKCSRETPYILGIFLFTSISSCLLNLLCSVQLFLFDDKGHGYVDIDAHQHVWNLRFVRFRESFVTAAYPLRVHDEVCSMCTVITWSKVLGLGLQLVRKFSSEECHRDICCCYYIDELVLLCSRYYYCEQMILMCFSFCCSYCFYDSHFMFCRGLGVDGNTMLMTSI